MPGKRRMKVATKALPVAPTEEKGKVVAHPTFRRIPPCKVPLKTVEGQKEYDTYARMLFDAGRMDTSRHVYLSLYASAIDMITLKAAGGSPPRASTLDSAMKNFAKLGISDLDKPIAAPADAPTNKYASSGFSARRR